MLERPLIKRRLDVAIHNLLVLGRRTVDDMPITPPRHWKHMSIATMPRVLLAAATAVPVWTASAADLPAAQKDGICRVSLARINANAPGDYRSKGKVADTFVYVSARGYTYECEVFSDGMAFTLSNADWGRLRPTGSVTTSGKCSNIKLFDPGFGITHELKSCVK